MARNFPFSSRFARDERGTSAVIFGIVIIPVIAIMGLAIDGWRALNTVTMATGAIDAAALAAAKGMNEEGLSANEATERARDYFNANFKLGAYGATLSGFAVNSDAGANTVTVTADLTVPTTFAGIFNVDSMTMSRSGTATYDSRDLELAMMLDVTGSMDGDKLRDLQEAAKDAVDILISDTPGQRQVRIGLAPYSAAVNAGPYANIATDGVSIDGCVFERSGTHAFDDRAPAPGRFLGAMPNPGRPSNGNYGCPLAEILPITDDKTTLRDRIDSYRAGGWTAGHLGIAWSWYLISPTWSGVWPGESQPVAYGDDDTIKAVILMTDGDFNTSYENGSRNQTSTRQSRRLCENMKAQGVIVYAVAFQAPHAAKRTLEECATSADHYFDAENGEDLRVAFRNVAINLANLRISQ